MDILKITVSDLQNGKYQQIFPDLYLCRGLVEKNSWHESQDVFVHILAVFAAFKKLLPQYPNLKSRLSRKVGNLTREEILTLMVIFHDVGKKYTLITYPDGTTMCPSHEDISAQLVLEQTKNLGLSDGEKETISSLVALHGVVNNVSIVYENKNDTKLLELFSQKARGWNVELALFMLADLEGSDLKKINNTAYLKRKQTLEKMLNFFLEG